jgi:GNAT superfamily N-acetyltransferase
VGEHAIWQLGEADAAAAGAVLGRAFLDAPLYAYALPDPAERARLCPPLFAASLHVARHFGAAWAIGTAPGAIAGVAYCVEHPRGEVTPEQAERWGLAAAAAAWGPAHGRLAAAARAIHEAFAAAVPARRLDLATLGVDPVWQGRGLGSALVAEAVAEAAAAGLPVGLWTTQPRNVPFYLRAGFGLVAVGASQGGALPWWGFLAPAPSPRPRRVARAADRAAAGSGTRP